MAKRADLTGLKFGKFTVLRYSHTNKNGVAAWVVKCDCGTIKTIRARDLVSGHTQSCGCLRAENANLKKRDLVGRRFGRLVVIGRDGYGKGNKPKWKCICDCKNETTVFECNLIRKHTTSCGCGKSEAISKAKFVDLTGRQFGLLTAIEPIDKDKWGNYRWICECACGNRKISSAGNLVNGHCYSCGCASSRIDNLVGRVFGRLTVKKFHGLNKYKAARWVVQCECGNVKIVSGGCLKNKNTQSCGCLNKEKYQANLTHRGGKKKPEEDLTGRRFGRLVVIGKTDGKRHWLDCVCDCGTKKSVEKYRLVYGSTRSCGCLNRDMIRQAATTHGQSGTKEYGRNKRRQRRSKEKNLDSGWTIYMEIALEEMYPVCVVCGNSDMMAVDHVRPLSLGYGLTPSNATRLCIHCNARKSDKMLEELDDCTREKILASSRNFEIYWESLHGEWSNVPTRATIHPPFYQPTPNSLSWQERLGM